MFRNYLPFPSVVLPQGTAYAQPTQIVLDHVRLDSPAIDAMTDLARVAAVIVNPYETVDEARMRMIRRGIRLLLVVDQARKVMGVITADDVSGERPVQIAAHRAGNAGIRARPRRTLMRYAARCPGHCAPQQNPLPV